MLHDNLLKFGASQFFRLHERLKRHTTSKQFHSLMNSQWLAPTALNDIQSHNLHLFLQQVFEHVPYYQAFSDIKAYQPHEVYACLKQLPLMSKSVMTDHFEQLKSRQARSFQMRTTGGSTGEPFKFLLTKKRISHDVAAKRRATRWWGVDIGDTELVIWGSPVEQKSQSAIKEIRDRLLRTQFVGSQDLDEKKALKFLQLIKRRQPKMLFGYPSILNYLARVALANKFQGLKTKVAFVTSEMLEDFQLKNIQQAFGCKVANGYGGRDLGFVAHACFEGQLHINHEDILVEIIDENGNACPPGQVGEIVVTHLATQDFPFIRYRSGDYGKLALNPCPCGRGLPVLAQLEGRVSDLIYAYDGSVVHRNQIIQLISEIPQIEQFRFEQLNIQHAKLMITGKPINQKTLVQLTAQFKSLLGSDTVLEIQQLSQLPATASGKHRFIISHLSTPPKPVLIRESYAN